MKYEWSLIGSYSIVIAVIIGLIRFPKIHRAYQPFIFINVVALLAEISSYILIYFKRSNAVSFNIMGLVEALLWLWQFKRWGIFNDRKWEYPFLVTLITGIWIFDKLITSNINSFTSWYSIASSFILVFLSINQVNRLIVTEKKNLFRNPSFLICSGMIIFYTYRIFVECFYLLEKTESNIFMVNIFTIMAIVNLFINLLFALATIWIPTRQRFSLPSS
jgi:hypothetical protein